jgi:hypothetical protein
MDHHRIAATAAFMLALSTLGACSKPALKANYTAISASLSGANEVPALTGKGIGAMDASLSPRTLVLAWSIRYADLSGPVTAAHFHGPARPGGSAEVVLPITGAMRSPITGSALLTAEQAAELGEGNWYVNLHTAAHPSGEIRGQLELRR